VISFLTETGADMVVGGSLLEIVDVRCQEFFPDDAHLASWTGLCPGNHESAGRRRSGKPRKGNTHLQTLLVECAWSAARDDGYLKSLYHRHVMRNGGYRSSTAKKKRSSWWPTP
jgi:transposase